MYNGFTELLLLLSDDHTLSAYELHSSGLVQALVNCLNVSWMTSILFSLIQSLTGGLF